MRLWSLHPKYLDAKGLVALWREGLLARAVLAGHTKGYRNHPQLERFRTLADPVAAVDVYLAAVLAEAEARGYRFDPAKIGAPPSTRPTVAVTSGQILFERAHLLGKLARRDPSRHGLLAADPCPEPHPMMRLINGPVESFEKVGAD